MQVAVDDDHHDASSVFALIDGMKNNTSTSFTVTILGTSIGVGCSNQTQLAQGHHINADLALVLPVRDGIQTQR